MAVQQLTSRGLSHGSSTARGSNHFLSGRGNCDCRSFSSTLQNRYPQQRAWAAAGASGAITKRIKTLYEIKLIQQQKLHARTRNNSAAGRKTFADGNKRSSRVPTGHLTETYFRNQDIKLNSQMVNRAKKNQGTRSHQISQQSNRAGKKIKQIEKLKDQALEKIIRDQYLLNKLEKVNQKRDQNL